LAFGGIELPFADHVHRFDARNECPSAAKCLESQLGSHPVVVLDDVVEQLIWRISMSAPELV